MNDFDIDIDRGGGGCGRTRVPMNALVVRVV